MGVQLSQGTHIACLLIDSLLQCTSVSSSITSVCYLHTRAHMPCKPQPILQTKINPCFLWYVRTCPMLGTHHQLHNITPKLCHSAAMPDHAPDNLASSGRPSCSVLVADCAWMLTPTMRHRLWRLLGGIDALLRR